MPETAEQANWRAEFQAAGESEVRQNFSNGAIYNSPPKRDFARQWLREQERSRELREKQMYDYTRRTLRAAVAAVIIGIIAVIATCLH
jgi:hypothetical protein